MSLPDENDRAYALSQTNMAPIQLAHLVLKTKKMPEMKDFYSNLLNAKIAFENEFSCFFRYDDEHHRVVIVRDPIGGEQKEMGNLVHFSFTYPTLGSLLGNYLRLKRQNIHPIWSINHGFTLSIYYEDPDRNAVETQFDILDTHDADQFMKSSYFGINPNGVDFDPDVMVEKYRSGIPLSELARQGAAPYADSSKRVVPAYVPAYDWRGEMM